MLRTIHFRVSIETDYESFQHTIQVLIYWRDCFGRQRGVLQFSRILGGTETYKYNLFTNYKALETVHKFEVLTQVQKQ